MHSILVLILILVNGDDDIKKMLLMHSFSNPDIQNWLPFILNSEKDMTDKLIMMSFLKKQESQGLASMDELMPLMMMQDNRHCTIPDNSGSDYVSISGFTSGLNILFSHVLVPSLNLIQ